MQLSVVEQKKAGDAIYTVAAKFASSFDLTDRRSKLHWRWANTTIVECKPRHHYYGNASQTIYTVYLTRALIFV